MATRFGVNKSDVKNAVFVLWLLGALVFAGASAMAATTYTWQKTDGGDMAVEGNWKPNTGLSDGQADAMLTISKDQSAPITLSQDLSALGGKHYFSFSGEMKFDDPETTLTLGGGHLYFNGDGKTLKFTQGRLVNKQGVYYENGSNPTRFILSGPNAYGDFQGVVIGSWQRNKSFEVEGGATFAGTAVTVGRDDNGASNDTFKVSGTGTTATLSGTLQVNNGGNNVAEISDGASLTAKDIVVGYWNKRDTTMSLTNVFNAGNKVRVDGGAVAVKGGAVTVGYHTCSNALEVVNGGTFTVISNVFNLTPTKDIGQTDAKSVPATYPSLNYRLNGNRVLVSGAGSLLKLDCGANQGFWLGRGIGDDSRVDVEEGGRWESAGEFKLGDGACSNCVFRVGPGGYFTHSLYGVNVGVSSACGPMSFVVDGGTSVVTSVATTIGTSGSGARLDVKNGGRYFGKALTVGSAAASSDCVVSVASGGAAEFSGAVMVGNYGRSALLVVDGGTFVATNDTTKAAATAGGAGSRLVVLNGGAVSLQKVYWGDQGSALIDCGIVVSNGTLTTSDLLSVGGGDNELAHGCWISIGGSAASVIVGSTLGINRDSVLSFDIPATGFAATPLRAKTLSFGTKCATRPTLKVTVDEKFIGGTVTLAETTNDITLPEELKLDLPPKARLVITDKKKLQVKIPRKGFVILFR